MWPWGPSQALPTKANIFTLLLSPLGLPSGIPVLGPPHEPADTSLLPHGRLALQRSCLYFLLRLHKHNNLNTQLPPVAATLLLT